VKEAFYVVELKGGGFTASREKFKDENEAQAISAACNGEIVNYLPAHRQ